MLQHCNSALLDPAHRVAGTDHFRRLGPAGARPQRVSGLTSPLGLRVSTGLQKRRFSRRANAVLSPLRDPCCGLAPRPRVMAAARRWGIFGGASTTPLLPHDLCWTLA
jgi:hypothetical protein